MSQVVSFRLKDQQMERLRKIARRLGRTPTEVGALLVEEGLREAEFAYVEFRDSAAGRQAYIKGSSLAVWEVVMVARDFGMDVTETAGHLRWPTFKVQAALNYAAAFPQEVSDALSDNDSYDFEHLSRVLPQLERFTAPEGIRTLGAHGRKRGWPRRGTLVLRLLLDEHLSPEIAEQLRRHRPEISIECMQAFRGGSFLGVDDPRLLTAAREDGCTLVTYDRRTIWPLLQAWGEGGVAHGGVIFVNRAAYAPHDIGALVRALTALWDAQGGMDWTNRAVYL